MKAKPVLGIMEYRMRHFLKSTGVALMAAGLFVGPAAAASMPSQGSLRTVARAETPIELAQYLWGGHNYCWYDDGWQGAGWYWCGYASRNGFGWGGREGFHGWGRGGHRGGPHGGGHPHGGAHPHGGGHPHGGHHK
jgi:hypothetical protein